MREDLGASAHASTTNQTAGEDGCTGGSAAARRRDGCRKQLHEFDMSVGGRGGVIDSNKIHTLALVGHKREPQSQKVRNGLAVRATHPCGHPADPLVFGPGLEQSHTVK